MIQHITAARFLPFVNFAIEIMNIELIIANLVKAGWSSWLSRIVNTDKVTGSSPVLVNVSFLLDYPSPLVYPPAGYKWKKMGHGAQS